MVDSCEETRQDGNLNPSVHQHRVFSVDPVLDHRPEEDPLPPMVEVSKTIKKDDKFDTPVLKHEFSINNSDLDHKSPVDPQPPMVKNLEIEDQCDIEIKQFCHTSDILSPKEPPMGKLVYKECSDAESELSDIEEGSIPLLFSENSQMRSEESKIPEPMIHRSFSDSSETHSIENMQEYSSVSTELLESYSSYSEPSQMHSRYTSNSLQEYNSVSEELQESFSEVAEFCLIDSEIKNKVFQNKGDNPDAAEAYSLNAAQLDSLQNSLITEDMGDNLGSCEEYIDSMHLMLFGTASFNETSKDSTQDLERWLDQRLELGCKDTVCNQLPHRSEESLRIENCESLDWDWELEDGHWELMNKCGESWESKGDNVDSGKNNRASSEENLEFNSDLTFVQQCCRERQKLDSKHIGDNLELEFDSDIFVRRCGERELELDSEPIVDDLELEFNSDIVVPQRCGKRLELDSDHISLIPGIQCQEFQKMEEELGSDIRCKIIGLAPAMVISASADLSTPTPVKISMCGGIRNGQSYFSAMDGTSVAREIKAKTNGQLARSPWDISHFDEHSESVRVDCSGFGLGTGSTTDKLSCDSCIRCVKSSHEKWSHVMSDGQHWPWDPGGH